MRPNRKRGGNEHSLVHDVESRLFVQFFCSCPTLLAFPVKAHHLPKQWNVSARVGICSIRNKQAGNDTVERDKKSFHVIF